MPARGLTFGTDDKSHRQPRVGAAANGHSGASVRRAEGEAFFLLRGFEAALSRWPSQAMPTAAAGTLSVSFTKNLKILTFAVK
jgi:hypothetical protein